MNLRVTPNILISRAIQAAGRHSSELAALQQQASSGLRLTKPSDDPTAMRSVLLAKNQDARLEAELSNIQDARSILNLSVTHLLEANDIFVRAKQIALEGIQATDPSEREILAKEVEGLVDRLLAIANAEHEGYYLFGGTAAHTAPFSIESDGPGGQPTTVHYRGSTDRSTTGVGSGGFVDMLYSGDEVFQSRARSDTVFIGQTGAAPGSGTDSGAGQATLSVLHTATTYAAGSGVQAGVSSPGGDTIIGPSGSHVLTIVDTSGNGTSGTVSLNGGVTVAFSNADADLEVMDPSGEKVYVDTTSITAGFSGDVAITAEGVLSMDGGTTTTPIDFSANQVVQNSLTGEVTNVDGSEIRQVGTEHVEYGGTADAITALLELRDNLRNTRELSQSARTDALDRRIADLDRARENVMMIVGEQSVSLGHLDTLEQKVRDIQLETRRTISENESADIAEVAIKLQNEQALLQFTLASTAIVLDQSLLDYLS